MHHTTVPLFQPLKLEAAYPGPDYNCNYNLISSNSISSPSPSTSSTMAKRALSDSDCEDHFTDTKDSCGSDAGGGPGHNVSRKKRRGIIEKRRRDRINNSLIALKNMIPHEKTSKLEKAEILQMTVEYIRGLKDKGLDGLAYDPHKFAMDYHAIGFRECIAETARYMEGHEEQNLKNRLLSHLNNVLSSKQVSASTWGLSPLTPNHSFPLTQPHHLPGPTNFTTTGGQNTSTMDGSPLNHHHQYLNMSSSSSGSSHTSPELNQGHHMGQRSLFPPHNSHIANNNSSPWTPVQNYPVHRPWGSQLSTY